MAIKVTKLEKQPGDGINVYAVSAFADTKEEVIPGATFIGMPTNSTMDPGSSVITADGKVAFLKSDGTWNWVE